ncbi:MAG TPA: TetR/AcrR family transcriptional regulator [Planctomycetota bacterium]|nr:TetR/AcrR family transcriptional regulator [Planctomycetota bacterium]
MPKRDMRSRLLDVAQELVQVRGFNAFSFHDLAARVRLRAPSVHHHFASKAELGRQLMARYRAGFGARLAEIESRVRDPRARLARFLGLFRETFRLGDRLCLCGMLATEYATLPRPVRAEVTAFYRDAEAWLARVFAAGREQGRLRFAGSPASAARMFFNALEGALIAARAFKDEKRLTSAGNWLIQALEQGRTA